MSTLGAADLHLRGGRYDEQYALEQIVDIAIARGVDDVLFLGDVLDRQQNRSEPVAFWHKQIGRLSKEGIRVRYVQGQHEYDVVPWLSGHEWAEHVHKKTFKVGPWLAYGLDFQPHGVLQEELARVPKECTVLAAHQGWSEWLAFEGAPQGDFAQVPEHVEIVLTGDFHPFVDEYNRNAGGKKMRCISPGTTVAQKIDEPHDNYVLLIADDGEIKRKKLKSRVFLDSKLMTRSTEVDEFLAGVEKELADAYQLAAERLLPEVMHRPILRVEYSHRLSDVRRRVERAVGDRAILCFYESHPQEEEPAETTAAIKPSAEAATPLSVLSDVVSKEEEPDVFGLVQRLLLSEAESPREELLRWRAEFLEAGKD